MPKATSLEALYEYLRKFHLSESLYLIAAVNASLKFGLAAGLHTNDIPEYITRWLERLPKNKSSKLIIYLSSTRLARFLILSGANDYRNKPLSLSSGTFNEALNMVGELYDEDLEAGFKSSTFSIARNALGRIGFWQFPLQEDRQTVIGRGYQLFVRIPAQLTLSYNFDEKMKEYYKMDCFRFMATGFAMWLMSNGTVDYQLNILIDELKGIITNESQLLFLKLSSGKPEDYRRAIRGDDWKKMNKPYDFYALDPFTKIPAIAVDNSLKFRKDSFVVPQVKYFLDRASTGIFYLLSDKEQEIGKIVGKDKQNPFRVTFGDVYRQYVKEQLLQANHGLLLIDLDVDFTKRPSTLIPDFALIGGSTCIVFEVKTTLLTITSRTFLDEEQLNNEIKKGSFKKAISQLDDFRRSILDKTVGDNRFHDVEQVINIMVAYEDVFVLNSLLLTLLKEHYGKQADQLQLATISDIDDIGNALNQNIPFTTLLTKKINDRETESWNISQFLLEFLKKDNQVLKEAYDKFMSRLGSKNVE